MAQHHLRLPARAYSKRGFPLILKAGVKGGKKQRTDLTQNKKYQNSTQYNNIKKRGRFIILNEKTADRTRQKILVTG